MGISDMTADLPCQGCGAKMPVKAVDLSPGKRVTCSKCGAVTTISVKGGGDPGKAMRDLEKAFKSLGRRR